MLIDPSRLTADTSKHYTVDYFEPSLDAKYLPNRVSEGGSQEKVLHLIETATRPALPDVISRARDGVSSWRPDNASFYYLRENKLAPGEPATDKEQKVRTFLHVLGADPESDVAARRFRRLAGRARARDGSFVAIVASPASNYTLAAVQNGVQNEMAIYAPSASVTNAQAPWQKIADVGDDDVTAFDVRGSTIYLLSHKNASNFKVLATSLASPISPPANVVAPSAFGGRTGWALLADGLYVRSRIGGFGRIARLALDDDGKGTGAAGRRPDAASPVR